MINYKVVFYEFLLLFASVLIFRSLWMILDKINWMNRDIGILTSLIAGIIVTLISLVRLNRNLDKKKEK